METEWKTVERKSTYVPPSMRGKLPENPKDLTLNSELLFPELSKAPKKQASAWGANKQSFSQKVKQLVINEQKTEEEREVERLAALERLRAQHEYAVLSLKKFTPERILEWNEKISKAHRSEQINTELAAIGYHKVALKPLTNQEREEIQNTLREIQEEQQEFEQELTESEEDYITEHH
jgi:hypothetical protein